MSRGDGFLRSRPRSSREAWKASAPTRPSSRSVRTSREDTLATKIEVYAEAPRPAGRENRPGPEPRAAAVAGDRERRHPQQLQRRSEWSGPSEGSSPPGLPIPRRAFPNPRAPAAKAPTPPPTPAPSANALPPLPPPVVEKPRRRAASRCLKRGPAQRAMQESVPQLPALPPTQTAPARPPNARAFRPSGPSSGSAAEENDAAVVKAQFDPG